MEAILDESMEDCFFLDDKNPSSVGNVNFITVLNSGDESVLVSSVQFDGNFKSLQAYLTWDIV